MKHPQSRSSASGVGEAELLNRRRIIETNPQTDPRWESFVVAHARGSIYHHPAWLKALSKEYRRAGVYLACEDDAGRFLAVMPLMHTRGLPLHIGGPQTRRRLSSLPRTPLAGPLSNDDAATVAILQAAVSRVSADPGVQLQIKFDGPELAGLVDGLGCAPWRIAYVLRGPANPGEPFRIANSHERAKVKWAINKAKKIGMRVRPAETEADLSEWYRLYLETMRRNAVPPRSYRFFAALWESLKPIGMMELLLAEVDEAGERRTLAGSIFLKLGQTVSYAFNGSRHKDHSLRANDLIQWESINAAFGSGFKYFDLGEVPAGHSNLAQFKSKWGAEPVRLYRYSCPPTPREQGTEDIAPPSHLLALAEAGWRRLPIPVTAWLGDRLYSYL